MIKDVAAVLMKFVIGRIRRHLILVVAWFLNVHCLIPTLCRSHLQSMAAKIRRFFFYLSGLRNSKGGADFQCKLILFASPTTL